MPPKVSIIVACRNEARYIRRFLDSLLMQEWDGIEWEAILADGVSGDGTAAIIEDYCRREPRIRLTRNEGRIVSSGLNAALRRARGEVILRMDAHTEYARDYVRQCLAALERTGADNVGGTCTAKAAGYVGQAIAAAFASSFCVGGARWHRRDYEGPADTVAFGCWPRAVFSRIGVFDESLVRNQDDEFNLRLTRAGGRIWQSPQIQSWYYCRSSLGALFQQYFQYGFWKVAVIRKHRMPASWRHLAPGAFVAGNLALAAGAAAGALTGFHSAAVLSAATLAANAALYAAACCAAAIYEARRTNWRLAPILPAVFATYQLAYGAGFLLGIARPPRAGSPVHDMYTALSR